MVFPVLKKLIFPVLFLAMAGLAGCDFERCDVIHEIPYQIRTPFNTWKFYRYSSDSSFSTNLRTNDGLQDIYDVYYYRNQHVLSEPDKNCIRRFQFRLNFRYQGGFYNDPIQLQFLHDSSLTISQSGYILNYDLQSRWVTSVNGTPRGENTAPHYRFQKQDTITVDGKLIRDVYIFPNPLAVETGHSSSITHYYFHGQYGLVRMDKKNGIKWEFDIF